MNNQKQFFSEIVIFYSLPYNNNIGYWCFGLELRISFDSVIRIMKTDKDHNLIESLKKLIKFGIANLDLR
jgi:hypothetical protein